MLVVGEVITSVMLKSEVTHVSGPSKTTRHRSGSESSDDEVDSKRSRYSSRSGSPRSDADGADDQSEMKSKQREEGELSSKPKPDEASKTAPMRTGGLYIPPAKLRLMQVCCNYLS